MITEKHKYDIIVVGSGATGGWAAKILTELGWEVLLLEAGPRLDLIGELRRSVSANLKGDRSENDNPARDQHSAPTASRQRQSVQSQCYAYNDTTKHLFVDDEENPYETPADKPFNWIRMRLLGGRTALWNRVALRMSDRQFKATSIDGFGSDWPISYLDLAHHYDAIESFVGVYGINEGLNEVPDGLFIPINLSASAQDFKHSIESRWDARKVTALRQVCFLQPTMAARELSAITQCDLNEIQPFYCSAVSTIAAAEQTGKLTLLSDAIVRRVITNSQGTRAVGVEYVERISMKSHEARANVIILCASSIESTRILFNSNSRHHPHGIGNSRGMLGRFLSEHTFGVNITGEQKAASESPGRFYIPNFRNISGKKERFLRGYGIQGHIEPTAAGTTQCNLWCFGETLPQNKINVTLSRDTKDKWGVPVPRIDFTFSQNENEMVVDQVEQMTEMLEAAGYDVTQSGGLLPPGSSMHEVGTARMGIDPQFSVLNHYCQCWNVPNLFVTDGAAFVSAGFQNPTLTMMAITGRACHYIARELARGAFGG